MKEKVRMIVLRAPLMGEDIYRLKSGDQVMVEGTVYAARDAAHKNMVNAI
jgi:fumarate hydratase subunit beta